MDFSFTHQIKISWSLFQTTISRRSKIFILHGLSISRMSWWNFRTIRYLCYFFLSHNAPGCIVIYHIKLICYYPHDCRKMDYRIIHAQLHGLFLLSFLFPRANQAWIFPSRNAAICLCNVVLCSWRSALSTQLVRHREHILSTVACARSWTPFLASARLLHRIIPWLRALKSVYTHTHTYIYTYIHTNRIWIRSDYLVRVNLNTTRHRPSWKKKYPFKISDFLKK